MQLSSEHLIRDIAERFQHSASYLAEEFATRLRADLKDVLNINWALAKDMWHQRKIDLVLSYGFPATERNMEKPFAYADGLAIIPVHGMLLNRFSGSYGFVTGYNFIRNQRQLALADSDVRALIYDYNTYGGTAAGCGELSKEMFDSRHEKPSLAVVDASCYSAGYFLASAQDQIIGSPSCGVGSIGCISMHVDVTEMLKEDGIKITFIRSAPRKMEGNPYEPLSDAAKKTIQASVDFHASAFIESVARNRNNLAESDIRNMQAACFDPPDALENGLLDAVQPPIEAVSSFLSSLNGGSIMPGTQGNNNDAAPTITMEQITQAISAGIATALPTALAAHDKAKTERRSAIMGCDEAKKRQKLAASLADNTDMTVDAAKVILSAAAEEQPERSGRGGNGNGFFDAMDRTGNPNVGGDDDPGDGNGGGDGNRESPTDAAARILDLYASHTGEKVVPIKKRA